MSRISVSNLTFAYEGSYDNVFENISFQIDTDWKLGLIGRNGKGKTTFLKLLLGLYEYQGTISSEGGFDYFPFQVDDPDLGVMEIAEQINPDCQQWQLKKELSLLEMPDDVLYRTFRYLSKGEQTKVLLAILFLKENDLLLIDEPTNHLDQEGRKIVGEYLKLKKGFVLVSHDRAFLDHCVDHILSINQANIEVQKGNFSSWFVNKQLQDQFEMAENEKLKKEIQKLDIAAKRTAGWSMQVEKSKYGNGPVDRGYIGHKSAKMMKRAKTTEKRQEAALQDKANLLKNLDHAETLRIMPQKYHQDTLVDLNQISIYYGDDMVCENISFQIKQGDRIALNGKNGSGKSSLLKLVKGEALSYSGDFRKGSNLIISYVSQDTSFLQGGLAEFTQTRSIEESFLKAMLRKLDFKREQFDKNMEDFSEGQKKKVLIAASLCEKAHLYIWDEPLNFIDVFSRMQIEELLMACQPTILFVEHDLAFTEKIATQIVRL